MLTYVINTSENKTFDSGRLFDLAGYNKIRWMHCSLSSIATCADEIHEKQNFLGADAFRVAVLIDFFGYDKIRPPYGRGNLGYGKEEEGVEFSLYLPYIEAYLIDNLFNRLNCKEVYAASFEVYYIQNGKYERFVNLGNAELQLASILSGKNKDETPLPEPKAPVKKMADPEVAEPEVEDPATEAEEDSEMLSPRDAALREIVNDPTRYTSYSLYCTKTVSLEFKLEDYPYGISGNSMSFFEFFKAFQRRASHHTSLRRYFFVTSYGESPARAAFDTLSLSLYLIRMYEREEDLAQEGEMEVGHLEEQTLREVLERAWNKVQAARLMAKGNHARYYALEKDVKESTPRAAESFEQAIERLKAEEAAKIPKDKKPSAEEMYSTILKIAGRTQAETAEDNRKEFDKIMNEYFKKRDETCENNVEAAFEEMRAADVLTKVPICPSKESYETLVQSKHEEISELFGKALEADYIDVDYSEDKHNAKSAYQAYCRAKSCLSRNIVGDVIFLALTILTMLIPYGALQLSNTKMLSIGASILYTLAAAIFGGLFILALFLQIIPQVRRMNKAKSWLKSSYLSCLAKKAYVFSKIRARYEEDLIQLEEKRYELRQYKHLFDANAATERNVARHREMLEEVQDQLSGMLNNLGVEPVFDSEERVDGEFDLTKSFRSRENGIYKVFSIEVIEKMFPRKGSDRK